MITVGIALVCGTAALAGGFIDSISGGGGLLTLPALMLCGIPSHLALGTNKISACLGTAVALFNFGKHGLVRWEMAAIGIPFSIIGSWLGSLLALRLHPDILGKIIIGLLPIVMLLTMFPHKRREDSGNTISNLGLWLALPLVCALLGCYDGFLGPGTGSFLILALNWCLKLNLIVSSATAKAFNLASNISAAISFIWHGSVIWTLGLIMAACFICGNLLGSQFAIKAGSQAVRKFLVVSLALLMASLVWRYFIAPML